MKNILNVDYYTRVHLFWTVLLLFIGFKLNHSFGDYITETNIFDLHFSRAGIAGIRMAAVYFMI
ncbi:hypothetical protein KIH41_13330 [Litoribacter ruber]|uniref:hypothetical protein n=1 Tax=Litoribacter ruber TaxID=702568 RepID=UPI001BDA4651|nr:hypothetical protein [Litoribacter ruber]MBT0812262.1 hypothetical protein [Litoribacter ruber]